VEVPPGIVQTLRYHERYDEHWLAFGASPVVHVRLDGCVNGWLLPARAGPSVVWLVEWVALAQSAAQLVGFLWVVALGWLVVRRGGEHEPRH